MNYYRKRHIVVTDHAYARARERLKLKCALSGTEYDFKIVQIAEETLSSYCLYFENEDGKYFLVDQKYWKSHTPVCMLMNFDEKVVITFKLMLGGF